MHLDAYALGTPEQLEQVAGWWTARLARAPQYELWLIRWPDGSSAPMHDHGGGEETLAPVRSETASHWL